MYSKMSKEDRDRLIESGFISKPKKRTPKKLWSLVWIYCGKEQVVASNKPYPLCMSIKKSKQKDSSFSKGVFKIM